MIYLDNAATTIHKPQQVIDAVTEAMTTFGNAARGTHESSLDASRSVFGTPEEAGRNVQLLPCGPCRFHGKCDGNP
jgi:selenocysteine lyase/cysteine desulfurase